jgi:preprotein translocase subunit YajC
MIPTDEIQELITPFLSAIVVLIFSLWFKDLATKIAKGIMFKIHSSFKEGDKVIIDGEHAVIVKIGMSYTVFAIYKTNISSSEVDVLWRYVSNERIAWLKIEKVINEHKIKEE